MRHKVSSNEKKCHCQGLSCPVWRPLVRLKISNNGRKCRCQKLACQPLEPPLRPDFHSNERKCRCQESTPRPWELLIHLNLSRNKGKCRCLRPRFQPLPSRKPLPRPLQSPLCPASHPPMLHCRLPHCVPPPPHAASRARLLQTTHIPPETARLIRCHNLWPAEDILFCLDDALPAFVTGIPALSSGPELWIAIHNYRPEPLQLHSGQNIGVLEVVTLADTPPTASRPGPPRRPPLPERLSPLQQQQLNDLFRKFSDVFSQGEDDLGSTPLLEHTIETHGPSLRQPY